MTSYRMPDPPGQACLLAGEPPSTGVTGTATVGWGGDMVMHEMNGAPGRRRGGLERWSQLDAVSAASSRAAPCGL
jgi:hypothetical protein